MKKVQIIMADYNSDNRFFFVKINNSRNINLREPIKHEINTKSVLGKKIKNDID